MVAQHSARPDYHAQYFNGQVQINAFNNEMFPAPPPDFNSARVDSSGYDAPPPQPDPNRLPTYESVVVINKEAGPSNPSTNTS
uniref:Ovule protein n=1 Tax=Steinernema glaseri TaxID=37863 RepID=A0A1I7YUI3_9BILA